MMDLTVRMAQMTDHMNDTKQDTVLKYEALLQRYITEGAVSYSVIPLWFGSRGGTDCETVTLLLNN